jgi:hypothetical protein
LPVALSGLVAEAPELGVERLIQHHRPVIVPGIRFRLVCAAEVVPWEGVDFRNLDGRPSRRVVGRVIMPLSTLIAH